MRLLRWLMDAPYNTYMASIIEDHPQRAEIDKLILAGKSLREIAAVCSPRVSHTAIQDYRRKALAPLIPKAAQAVAKQAVAIAQQSGVAISTQQATDAYDHRRMAAPFVSRLQKRADRRDDWIKKAAEKDDFRALASLDTCEYRDIELEARLTGALDNVATSVTAQVLVLMPDQHDRPAIQRGDVIDVTPE